jgi:hypothetical protein
MELFTNAVVWVEIPVINFDRAKLFYSTIYGYQMPEMLMAGTRMGFLLYDQNTGVGAAIVQGEGYVPSSVGSKVYLNGGADLNIILAAVAASGGKVIRPKTFITTELGYFAVFEDTEGNHISLQSKL